MEHDDAQALLRSRYRQLEAMQIAQHPVIAVRIERTTSWGNLSVAAGLSLAGRSRERKQHTMSLASADGPRSFGCGRAS